MRAAVRRLSKSLRAFRSARGGNVAVIFAFATVPMIGLIGAAVDYSRGNSVRSSLQAALDSTALMLSKDAPNLNQAQLSEKADKYFKALFSRTEAANVQITPTFSSPQAGSFRLDVSASATVDTTFMAAFTRLLGVSEIQNMKIESTAQVQWGVKRIELALALDNTGSMASSGKMTQLKKAVHSLLDTLEKAAKKPDDVKLAIIPFDTMVRLDQDDDTVAPWVTFDTRREKRRWQGCVEDRDQPNDAKDTPPDLAVSSTLFPAQDCSNDGALVKMRELTNDWTALHATVNQMNPNGNTNVTIGLVWAWHALTQNQPFNQASAPDPNLDKVIILLTDGENTKNRWTFISSQIDERTKAACDNVKAANIKLYTVRVIDGNKSLLQSCATNPGMFYDVQQADQLNNVFSAIAQNLANLRLAK
jgi:Flp pilus assembly protein TadG